MFKSLAVDNLDGWNAAPERKYPGQLGCEVCRDMHDHKKGSRQIARKQTHYSLQSFDAASGGSEYYNVPRH